jgi:hypothetical protein
LSLDSRRTDLSMTDMGVRDDGGKCNTNTILDAFHVYRV